jgi:hypothetical protein
MILSIAPASANLCWWWHTPWRHMLGVDLYLCVSRCPSMHLFMPRGHVGYAYLKGASVVDKAAKFKRERSASTALNREVHHVQ